MTNIDQFESVFKSAVKPRYAYRPVDLDSVLLVTDLEPDATARYAEAVERMLAPGEGQPRHTLDVLDGGAFQTVGELLEQVESRRPDLVCTYRNLHSSAWKWPHSLGSHVDVLTQVGTVAVLLLPRPQDESGAASIPPNRDSVMAITDHLAGDRRLVDYAVSLTAPAGTLWLTHVEDELTFSRYIETIGKIPEIDTDLARETLLMQLLKEPHDYVGSCRAELKTQRVPVEVEELVTLGERLRDYRRLVEEHEVDLLVLNTKDHDQLAMHGMAHELTVELRTTPMLLL